MYRLFVCSTFAFALVAFLIPTRSAFAYRYTHEVLPGETLGHIAVYYHTKVARIKKRNKLSSSRLRVGQKLKIITSAAVPRLEKRRYKVRAGDSLTKIARKHRMKLAMLKRMNRRAARRPLRVGQPIWVVKKRGRPQGRVKGLIQLTGGFGYQVRDPKRSWATFVTAMRMDDVFTAFAREFPEAAPVEVLDISRERGGWFPPHVSHQRGRDVDIRYQLLPKYRGVGKAQGKMLDLERTWFLVKSFIDTGDVVFIFMDRRLQRALYSYALAQGETKRSLSRIFEYPRRRGGGIIRHDPGHRTHFHVRFRSRPSKPQTNA